MAIHIRCMHIGSLIHKIMLHLTSIGHYAQLTFLKPYVHLKPHNACHISLNLMSFYQRWLFYVALISKAMVLMMAFFYL